MFLFTLGMCPGIHSPADSAGSLQTATFLQSRNGISLQKFTVPPPVDIYTRQVQVVKAILTAVFRAVLIEVPTTSEHNYSL